MPICDGVEACKRLRILEGTRKVSILLPSKSSRSDTSGGELLTLPAVVALSADCQESTKQLCLSAGMNGFLSKPLKKSMFYKFVLCCTPDLHS